MTTLEDFLARYGIDGHSLLFFQLLHNQELIMAAIDDLNTAVANLGNVVQNEVIPKLTAPPPVNNDPAISAAATSLNSIATALHNAVTPTP